MDILYTYPTIIMLFFFMIIVTAFSIVGLYTFRKLAGSYSTDEDCGQVASVFISTVSVFLGVSLSFLIVVVWNGYTDAKYNDQLEAEAAYTLHGLLSVLPDTENTQQLIIDYLKYVVQIEFPKLENGENVDKNNPILQKLRSDIYNISPTTPQQSVLYNQIIETLNNMISYRISRLDESASSVNSILWWVAIIDSALLIFMSWTVYCISKFHYILVAIVSIYVASSIFAILILSNPYRGTEGLTSDPYQEALDIIST